MIALATSISIYRKIGGALHDRKDVIENKWSDAVQRVKDGEAALRDLAGGAAPLLLVRGLLESAEMRDRHEEECRRARELADALEDRDRAALEHLRGQKARKQVVDALEGFEMRSDNAFFRSSNKPPLEHTSFGS